MGSMKFDAEKANRAGDAKRELFVPASERRKAAEAAIPVRLYAAPLSAEAIARCRTKARARRPA